MMNAHIIQALEYRKYYLLISCVKRDIPTTVYVLGVEECDRQIERELMANQQRDHQRRKPIDCREDCNK